MDGSNTLLHTSLHTAHYRIQYCIYSVLYFKTWKYEFDLWNSLLKKMELHFQYYCVLLCTIFKAESISQNTDYVREEDWRKYFVRKDINETKIVLFCTSVVAFDPPLHLFFPLSGSLLRVSSGNCRCLLVDFYFLYHLIVEIFFDFVLYTYIYTILGLFSLDWIRYDPRTWSQIIIQARKYVD